MHVFKVKLCLGNDDQGERHKTCENATDYYLPENVTHTWQHNTLRSDTNVCFSFSLIFIFYIIYLLSKADEYS